MNIELPVTNQNSDLIARYKVDPESGHISCIVGSEIRMKTFRTFRHGVQGLVLSIAAILDMDGSILIKLTPVHDLA